MSGGKDMVAGASKKAASLLKKGGAKAKSTGSKVYAVAKDPDVQAKIKTYADDSRKIYDLATSPEAKRAYQQTLTIIKKARRK